MESLDLRNFAEIPLPKFVKVKQNFKKDKIENVEKKVQEVIKPHLNNLEGKRIAVGVGSRGIANIAKITKTVIDCLKEAGAKPFIVPAMGSHGGATAEGQTFLLSSYGVTKEAMGVEIDASMEVESIGEYEPGLTVYVSKSALEADGIVIIPRIKLHTAFRGEIESGACKMLVIGLGKQRGADSVHSKGFGRFEDLIPGIGRMIAEKTKMLLAVGLVENGYDQTAEIEVLTREDIIGLEKEKALLRKSAELIARVLIPKFDVLVMDEIGKNISGDGHDPNVSGRFCTPYATGGADISRCVIRGLSKETHGNANGIGGADVTTRKCFDEIDFIQMYTNCFTSTVTYPCMIPMVAANSEDAIKIAAKMCNGIKPGEQKIVWIKSTAELGEIMVSEPLLEEVKANPNLEILTEPEEMKFENGEPVFKW